jgi:hypothetical protein
MIFTIKFLQVSGDRKEPESQFVFSALGGNLISALLCSRPQLHNTVEKETKTIKAIFLYEKMFAWSNLIFILDTLKKERNMSASLPTA